MNTKQFKWYKFAISKKMVLTDITFYSYKKNNLEKKMIKKLSIVLAIILAIPFLAALFI